MNLNSNLFELNDRVAIAARKRYIHKAWRQSFKSEWHERIVFNMIRSNFDNNWKHFACYRKGGGLEHIKGAAWATLRQQVLTSAYLNVTKRNHITIKPGVTIDTYIRDMNYDRRD